MAMTPAGLAAKIIEEIGTVRDPAVQQAFADALSKAIVEYIQQNAVVITPEGNGTIQ